MKTRLGLVWTADSGDYFAQSAIYFDLKLLLLDQCESEKLQLKSKNTIGEFEFFIILHHFEARAE